MRISTMMAAPSTCHQTEMLLKMASRWLEKMLTAPAMAKMITK